MNTMTQCRACKEKNLFMYLPLGDHPAANAFPRADQLGGPERKWPLDTHVCLDCALIQVPDQFYREEVGWAGETFGRSQDERRS